MAGDWEILVGDALDVLRGMAVASVHCCVTSPPYFALRDYGTGRWEGGDPGCDHKGPPHRTQAGFNERYFGRPAAQGDKQGALCEPYHAVCGKCGARRVDRQIGLEETPALFVARLVEVFREVRRILRPDGTCWVNIGDSYGGGKQGGGSVFSNGRTDGTTKGLGLDRTLAARECLKGRANVGIKPKDLLGIPWQLAFALRDDGWYLRSEIIWAKRAPMPESVTDRPTKAHESIFLLTAKPTYFYDQDAERIPSTEGSLARWGKGQERYAGRQDYFQRRDGDPAKAERVGDRGVPETHDRNLWSWWADLGAEPFPEAHFATFPPSLPTRCIRLGTSERGCCPACGAPWVRAVRREGKKRKRPNEYVKRSGEDGTGNSCANTVAGVSVETLGWEASCRCDAGEPVPCTVLDPFAGAGTTILAARRLGRRAVGIELNPDYAEMARRRVMADLPLFNGTARSAEEAAPAPGLFDDREEP